MFRRSVVLRNATRCLPRSLVQLGPVDIVRGLSNASAQKQTSSPMPTTASWSSPTDRIARNVFSNDFVHAWTLLEVCLEHKNMDRAESVLFGLTEFSGGKDITLAVNTFLQRLIGLNTGRPQVASDWLRRMSYQIPKFVPDEVTEALMLQNAALATESDPRALEKEVSRLGPDRLVTLLKRFELLGGETVKKALDVAHLPPSKLDRGTQKAFQAWEQGQGRGAQAEADSESDVYMSGRMRRTLGGSSIADPIPKEGFETIEATESPGLIGVRHVLSGLQRKSKQDKKHLSALAELADLPHVQEKSPEDIDFVDMYRQLKTDEERKKFNEILDLINERRQKNIELRGIEAARMKWKQMFDQMVEADRSGKNKVQLKGLETLLWEWNQAMLPLVEEEIKKLRVLTGYRKLNDVPRSLLKETFGAASRKSVAEKFEYAPYLTLATPENLPAMTMMELLRLNSDTTETVRSVKAILNVGKNVEREYQLSMIKSKAKSQRREAVLSRNGESSSLTHAWPTSIRAKIGSSLISMLMQVARVPVTGTDPVTGEKVRSKSPAFHHTYQYKSGNKVGVIRPHKVVAKYLSGERPALQPQQLPMLCEPQPWTSWNKGGYWYSPSLIIRSKDSPEQLAYIAAASDRGQMQGVFDGLNVLGRTAWTVNKEIFKVVSEAWNSKQAFLDIPPHVNPLPDLSSIPQPPRNADPGALRDYRRACRKVTLENGSLYSQRCDLNYKLDIARALLGERFYMPHNIDFRGRAYPLSPHFNHLGNDVSRSLLSFWDTRKLGPRGLYWLKIHLANLFGVNKSSHDERVAFVDSHMEQLLESAKDPLGTGTWWQEAESPFQALAACFEIRNALNHPEGPENFESSLSVHQDGSCNGLQHYAALGGDFEGAREVNLEKADRPQDVYSRVLEIVKAKVLNEKNSDHVRIAKLVYPVLTRKVVKQTVMTNVYGVTYVGAREQIANRLRDIDDFPEGEVFKSAAYLALQVLSAVRELFESAHKIQDWLADNATRITRAIVPDSDLVDAKSKFVSSVIWTTPLGLPIVQPYRNEKRHQVDTALQSIFITDPYSFQDVNARKQRMAFPPNYIHSLDATHMLMSALACSNDGIAFAAVHDSYWTHAADVDTLNKNLREQFVELHSANLVEKLRDEFLERYGNHLEVVDIPVESDAARRVIELRSAANKRPKLSVADQLEMEINRDEGEETPLDVMRSLGADEIHNLIDNAQESKKGLGKLRRPHTLKSTEHEGSGLEKLEEIEEEVNDLVASKPALNKGSKNLTVLVPLTIPNVPPRDKFEVKNVLDSPYFFS